MTGKPKYDIKAQGPSIATSPDGSALTIRMEILVNTPKGQRGSGKDTHLSVRPIDGMLLLQMLKRAQETHGWEDAPEPNLDYVPPARERN